MNKGKLIVVISLILFILGLILSLFALGLSWGVHTTLPLSVALIIYFLLILLDDLF
jgi:hypothetical protein